MRLRHPLALACAAMIALAGCGGGNEDGGGETSANARPAPASPEIVPAQHPERTAFPPPEGRTLREIADTLAPGPEVGMATSVYTPGRNRLAFGLIDPADNRFVYGPTAVYVARRPGAPARGPYLAPADSLEVRTAFRSQTSNSTAGELKAIYRTTLDLPTTGRWFLLTVTDVRGEQLGATADVVVRAADDVPEVGEEAPRVDTPTAADAGGDIESIDTRVPPSDMHRVNLRDVLGSKPVALLFATPALCQSRVCGPVADIGAQLQAAYGDEVEFIHNEVYRDNDVDAGLRSQLTEYGLTTEPWLFAIDRDGRVAARLEGAFGIDEYRDAVEAALGSP